MLIEEAAGLGKHRKRRRNAQLKLERTQDNLDRALDVEREARTRLKPLKRQAEAAELHERIERQSDEARWTLARDNSRVGPRGAGDGRAGGGRGPRRGGRGRGGVHRGRRAPRQGRGGAFAARRRSARRCPRASTPPARAASASRCGWTPPSALIGELEERITRREGGIAALQAEIEADTGDDGAEERIAGAADGSWRSSPRTTACGWNASSPSSKRRREAADAGRGGEDRAGPGGRRPPRRGRSRLRGRASRPPRAGRRRREGPPRVRPDRRRAGEGQPVPARERRRPGRREGPRGPAVRGPGLRARPVGRVGPAACAPAWRWTSSRARSCCPRAARTAPPR